MDLLSPFNSLFAPFSCGICSLKLLLLHLARSNAYLSISFQVQTRVHERSRAHPRAEGLRASAARGRVGGGERRGEGRSAATPPHPFVSRTRAVVGCARVRCMSLIAFTCASVHGLVTEKKNRGKNSHFDSSIVHASRNESRRVSSSIPVTHTR